MKYYFTLISGDYRSDKNQLETAAKKATREASHRLVAESDLKGFKNEFMCKIKELNGKYPRCRPLEPHNFTYHIDSKGCISIDGVCDLDFYEAKNEI